MLLTVRTDSPGFVHLHLTIHLGPRLLTSTHSSESNLHMNDHRLPPHVLTCRRRETSALTVSPTEWPVINGRVPTARRMMQVRTIQVQPFPKVYV